MARFEIFIRALFLGVLLAASGCSPSSFFGDGKDTGVTNQTGYHKINVACSSLNISSARLDVPTFRKIVHCFNAYGGLQPVEDLMDPSKLTDAQVQPLVDLSNQYILGNKKFLYQLDQTYWSLRDSQALETTLQQFGKLTENQEFISSTISLFKDGYYSDSKNRVPDPVFLRAIEHFSDKISADGIQPLLDVSTLIASSNALESFVGNYQSTHPDISNIKPVSDAILNYLNNRGSQEHLVERELIHAISSNHLLEVFDQLVGLNESDIAQKITRTSSVIKLLMMPSARDGHVLLEDLMNLFSSLNVSIPCMQGAKSVSNADYFVLDELASHPPSQAATIIRKSIPLLLVSTNPICAYPSAIHQDLPLILPIAEKTPIEPMAELIQAMAQLQQPDPNYPTGIENKPLFRLMTDLLSDIGSGSGGLQHLIPVLKSLDQNHVWDDLLLTGALVRAEDRTKLLGRLDTLVNPLADLNNQSVLDVFAEVIRRGRTDHLLNFFWSMRSFVNSKDRIFDPALHAMRSAYYVNNVHPVVDIAHEIAANATKNAALFDTLFLVSDRPEFGATIRLFSDMAKDGRMKQLIEAVVTLFHQFAVQGEDPVIDGREPALPLARHELPRSGVNIVNFDIGDEIATIAPACSNLDPGIPMDDPNGPGFSIQLGNVEACINSDGNHGDAVQAIQGLDTLKVSDGRTLYGYFIDCIRNLDITAQMAADIANSWIRSFDSGEFQRILKSASLFFSRYYPGDGGSGDLGPALRPLFDALPTFLNDTLNPQIRYFENLISHLITRNEIGDIVDYAKKLNAIHPEPDAPFSQNYNMTMLKDWIEKKECNTLPPPGPAREAAKEKRANGKINDYENSVTTWDLVNSRPRFSWTDGEFQSRLTDLFARLQPTAEIPNRSPIHALLNFMTYFSLPPGRMPNRTQHYPPDYLATWLHLGDNDYQPIVFFYPDQTEPVVRLVDSLDRAEIVLLGADFMAPWPINKNYSLQFLADLAEAWGDEPRNVWPFEIRAKFPAPQTAPRLADVVANIKSTLNLFENIVGTPSFASCVQGESSAKPCIPCMLDPSLKNLKYSIYNVQQTVKVLDELLPGTGNGGLKVYRDLFFEVYYSTPPQYQKPDEENLNKLSIILRLVRLGLNHQAGRVSRVFQKNDSKLGEYLRSDIASSGDPSMLQMANDLIVGDQKQTFVWAAINKIRDMIKAAEVRDLPPDYQAEIEGKTPDEIANIEAGWALELRRLYQMNLYSFLALGELDVLHPFMAEIAPVVHQDYAYLLAHSSSLLSNLRTPNLAWFTRAFYEDSDTTKKGELSSVLKDVLSDSSIGTTAIPLLQAYDNSPGVQKAWTRFDNRLSALQSDPDYQNLNLSQISQDTFDYLWGPNLTAQHLRLYLAGLMASQPGQPSEIEKLLILARDNPDSFYKVLNGFGNSSSSELEDFFATLRRSLSD